MDTPYDNFVRPYVDMLPCCPPRLHNEIPFIGAASFTIYSRTKEYCRDHHIFHRNTILNVSTTGGIGYVITTQMLEVVLNGDLVALCLAPWSHLEVLVSKLSTLLGAIPILTIYLSVWTSQGEHRLIHTRNRKMDFEGRFAGSWNTPSQQAKACGL